MMLLSVIVFYSEKPVKILGKPKKMVASGTTGLDPEISHLLLRLKYDQRTLPFKEYSRHDPVRKKNRSRRRFSDELIPVEDLKFSSGSFLPEEETGNLPSLPVKLKSQCCEKYIKDKRCRRCPCFDLPFGPASRED